MSKRGKLVFLVIGAALGLLSLIIFLAFLSNYTWNRPIFGTPLQTHNIVIFWVAILGTALPAATLLVRALRQPREDASAEDDLPGDYDDEDAP